MCGRVLNICITWLAWLSCSIKKRKIKFQLVKATQNLFKSPSLGKQLEYLHNFYLKSSFVRHDISDDWWSLNFCCFINEKCFLNQIMNVQFAKTSKNNVKCLSAPQYGQSQSEKSKDFSASTITASKYIEIAKDPPPHYSFCIPR